MTPNEGLLPDPYLLASDHLVLPPYRPGRGCGFFPLTADPVVVIPSHVLLEAFMRICARYAWRPGGGFSMSMIYYVQLYIDKDGYLDVGRLPVPLAESYKVLSEGIMPVRPWMLVLKRLLGEDETDWRLV